LAIIWFTYEDLVFLLTFFLMVFLSMFIFSKRLYRWSSEFIFTLIFYIFIDGVVFYIFLKFIEKVFPEDTMDYFVLAGPVTLSLIIFAFLVSYHDVLFSKEKWGKFRHEFVEGIAFVSIIYNGVLMMFILIEISVDKGSFAIVDIFTLYLRLLGKWGGAETGIYGLVSITILALSLILTYVFLGIAFRPFGRENMCSAYLAYDGFITCDRALLGRSNYRRIRVGLINIKLCSLVKIMMALDSIVNGRRTVSYVCIGDSLKTLRTLFNMSSRTGGIWWLRRRAWKKYEEKYMALLFPLWALPLAYALPFLVIGFSLLFTFPPEYVLLLVSGDYESLKLYNDILASSTPLIIWIVLSCLFVWLYMKWFIGYYYWHKLSNIEEVIRFFRRLLQSIIYYVARSIDRPLRLVLVGEYGGVERIGRAALRGVEAYVCEIQPR